MTVDEWLVVLYSIAGSCALAAAIAAFFEIGKAAKLARDLQTDPFDGNAWYQHLDTDFETRTRKSQMAKLPPIVLQLLGNRRQRLTIGALVTVGLAAGTAADLLAVVR